MSTTPTLREAARQALDALGVSESLLAQDKSYHHPQVLKAYNDLSAALTQAADAGAVEPVATIYTMEALVPGGSVKHHATVHKALPAGTKLYAAPPAQQFQQAVARALAPIQQAIRDYHYALDTRQHGGNAERNAFAAIRGHLGMHWKQGEEAAIRQQGKP